MGGQLLISIFSVRSGSEALAVSLEENYWSQFFRQEQLGGSPCSQLCPSIHPQIPAEK